MSIQLEQAKFAEQVLERLGIKPTQANVTKFMAWEQQEGGNWHNAAKYNPLNTTLPKPGAGNTGSQGNIKVYTSWAQGVEATAQTLASPAYRGIIANLRSSSSDLAPFEAAVNASPWGTKFPGGGKGGGEGRGPSSIPGGETNVQGAVEAPVNAAKEALNLPGSIFAILTSPDTYLRFAEAVGGMVLLAMGLKTLTRGGGGGAVAEAGRQARAGHHLVRKAAEAAVVL